MVGEEAGEDVDDVLSTAGFDPITPLGDRFETRLVLSRSGFNRANSVVLADPRWRLRFRSKLLLLSVTIDDDDDDEEEDDKFRFMHWDSDDGSGSGGGDGDGGDGVFITSEGDELGH